MTAMKALWLENQFLTFRDDLPIPKPLPGEALIRVTLAGICATDLELTRGYYPYSGIPGHEFVGQVMDSPSNPEWVGRRVVGEINVVCGTCENCRHGRPTHCNPRKILGIKDWPGSFAEYLTLPLINLHPVPDSLPDESVVFTEPLAAALEILEQVAIRPSDRVLLVGAGRLGQLVARVLSMTGCRLQVVARYDNQRRLLSEEGIDVISEKEVSSQKMDIVVEASGSPEGFELARRAVRPRGFLILKSTYAGEVSLNLSLLVVDEVTLVGSRCGPFEPALRLLKDGQIDPVPLISVRFPLSDGPAAFEMAARPGVLKVLLEI